VTVLQVVVLVLAGGCATCVVLTREPLKQAMLTSIYGLVLGVLFFVWQAPDVALSQTAVGAVALPLMILLALAKIRGGEG
jgi:energy-converting hydrogenase B subunit D